MYQVRIHRFLEKTTKKNAKDKKSKEVEGDTMTVEQEFLRKKVTGLMKKKKIHIVKMIVKRQDGTKPWGQVARARV